MGYYNQQQPPVGVSSPQGYIPDRYPKDGYQSQGHPPAGYPQQGNLPPHQQQSNGNGCMEGWNLDVAAHTKYKKYDADYVRRLKAKYFSKNDLYRGDIFDKETIIEDELIKSSSRPCTRSFTNPVESFKDRSRSSSSLGKRDFSSPK